MESKKELKEYTDPEYIAKGTTSTVYSITKISDGTKFVLKVIIKKYEKTSMNEYKISKILTCENKHIICYIDSVKYKDSLAYIMNYIPNFTLTDYIKNRDNNDLKIQQLNIEYFKQILTTVNYMHNKNVVHRDLKPDNLLLNNGMINIIDLGFAASLNVNPETIRTLKGTPYYLSPEMWMLSINKKLLDNMTDDEVFELLKKSDVYSLGIIGYYLFFNELPIQTKNLNVLRIKTMDGDIDIKKNKILSLLLTTDYKKRLTLEEIIKNY